MSLLSVLVDRITKKGSLSFSEFQSIALYHPREGYYSATGGHVRAGRSGDFITSPELGSLFGEVIAIALDGWWRALGCPEPYFVIEAGAGSGALAESIASTKPDCSDALRYVLVEQSQTMRDEQQRRLPLVDAHEVLSATRQRHVGRPLITSVSSMPSVEGAGVVLANELLDNLPVDVFEFREQHWFEVRVDVDESGALAETMTPVNDHDTNELLRDLAPTALDGSRVPVQRAACDWLQQALKALDRGRVIVFDYTSTTTAMSHQSWHVWMRTYAAHQHGRHPLDVVGSQDITCDVAVDQLALIRAPLRRLTQTDFLDEHGLLALMSNARAMWHERASIGDLEALRWRSRLLEGRALREPDGLGRHTVLEWKIDGDAG